MPKKIKVGFLTNGGGAHVGAYLNALRDTDACSAVVLADPDGKWANEAQKVLGEKLKGTYRDHKQMLTAEKPVMSIVTMEARLAPPVIDLALEHGCHVFAEKPACLRAEDFVPLIKKANEERQQTMVFMGKKIIAQL